jgi:hypothetical protein
MVSAGTASLAVAPGAQAQARYVEVTMTGMEGEFRSFHHTVSDAESVRVWPAVCGPESVKENHVRRLETMEPLNLVNLAVTASVSVADSHNDRRARRANVTETCGRLTRKADDFVTSGNCESSTAVVLSIGSDWEAASRIGVRDQSGLPLYATW